MLACDSWVSGCWQKRPRFAFWACASLGRADVEQYWKVEGYLLSYLVDVARTSHLADPGGGQVKLELPRLRTGSHGQTPIPKAEQALNPKLKLIVPYTHIHPCRTPVPGQPGHHGTASARKHAVRYPVAVNACPCGTTAFRITGLASRVKHLITIVLFT